MIMTKVVRRQGGMEGLPGSTLLREWHAFPGERGVVEASDPTLIGPEFQVRANRSATEAAPDRSPRMAAGGLSIRRVTTVSRKPGSRAHVF